MAVNQKLILLMLITTFLMCSFQGVSHGGSFFGALFGFGTGLGTAIVATIGGVGTTLAVTAGTVLTAVGAGDLGVVLIDVATWQPGSPSNMAFTPNRSGWLGIMDSNHIYLGNPYAASPRITFTYGSPINSIAFDPGGSLLASGSVDNTIQLWDPTTSTLLATLEGHTESVLSVAFSPDGSRLASGGGDGTVRLWDPATETLLATLETHKREVLNVTFSLDGQLLASGSGDGLILLWDLATETPVAKLETHMDDVLDIAFSPDRTLLASASADGLAGLWNLTTETLDATLGHESPVLSIAFSPDGDLLATGSADGVARLWDPHVPEHIGTLGHESPVTSVGFDGGTLFSRSADGAIRRWAITTSTAGSQQLESVCQVEDILSAGESCTYPDTDATFSVLDNGNAQLDIPGLPSWFDNVAIGGSLSITTTINGESYHFVATELSSGSWKVEELGASSDTDSDETPGNSESQPDGITASTASPLTETTLHESDVTLTLSGGAYERSSFRIRDAITLSGISGVAVGTFGVDRISDTEITVELEFNGDFDTNATLIFTVGAGAIANYSGTAFTAQVPVSASTESLVASTTAPLTEATLDESVVTLTLSGRAYESSSYTVARAITVSGIDGVTFRAYDVDRVSDTEVTVELTFDGNFQTDSRLIFTVGADAIAGYGGSAFSAQIPVTAGLEADANNDGVVNIEDLELVAWNYGQTGTNAADVNGDGVVNAKDLLVVAGALDNVGTAPSADSQVLEMFTAADVKLWLSHARQLDLTDPAVLKGILFLEQLLAALIPKETVLLPNYPNPFNPETWIPYRLAADAFVTLTIYDGSRSGCPYPRYRASEGCVLRISVKSNLLGWAERVR